MDSNTGLPIEGGKRRAYSIAEGKYDLGHVPGHEHWREVERAKEEKLIQAQFNGRMNDASKYQIEDPAENQSHRHEMPKHKNDCPRNT